MNGSVVSQIEDSFNQLSLSDQLWLIERLVQRIREQTLRSKNDLNAQLDAMAADPDIRREIRQIENEFSVTEADGLDAGR